MRVLVTGAAGFIGSYIAVTLAEQGFDVTCLDNLSRAKKYALKLLGEHGLELVKADIRHPLDIPPPDWVVHCAAYISVEESIVKPAEYCDVNVTGTVKLFKHLYGKGTRNFLYVSSAAVYGKPLKLPVPEDHPLNPLSPYGASKVSAEVFVRTFSRYLPGYNYVIVRPFNVYGPGQSGEYAGVIAKFAERLVKGEPPVIYGSGEQTRDFIYIQDLTDAILTIITENVVNETFNVGTGMPTTINTLAKLMAEIAGVDVEPIHAPPRPGDIPHSYADITKIRKVGWRPKTALNEGLRRTYQWHKNKLRIQR